MASVLEVLPQLLRRVFFALTVRQGVCVDTMLFTEHPVPVIDVDWGWPVRGIASCFESRDAKRESRSASLKG